MAILIALTAVTVIAAGVAIYFAVEATRAARRARGSR